MTTAGERLSKLLEKCRSTDVDVKVDAISKLQAEFESGIELSDVEGVISALKTCLRTSNQHLYTVTLSALPSFCTVLVTHPRFGTPTSNSSSSTVAVDSSALRQALLAFLPVGGVIDRLGDGREKTRDKAREAVISLGAMAHKFGSPTSTSLRAKETVKGPEPPLSIFERHLREVGFASKAWRVREQTILSLVHLRRGHPQFPIRPYISQLVETLEDGDGAVRECSRQSVVELFSGQGVTDAARADLKKEMIKKGVRKTIVDGILAKLLGGPDRGDSPHPTPPPSVAEVRKPTVSAAPSSSSIQTSSSEPAEPQPAPPRAAADSSDDPDISPVYIASAKDLEQEFHNMLPSFEGKETEHNWFAREQAVNRIRGMLKGEAHISYSDAFITGLKSGVLDKTFRALASLRTTVSSSACLLYCDLAVGLGISLDPFVDALLTNLLKMAGFTKKITASQSQGAVSTILRHTSAQPRIILNQLWNTLQEKTIQARLFVIGHVRTYLEVHGIRSKQAIENSGGLDLLEKSVRKGLVDPNVGVREQSRICFWAYEAVWKSQGLAILESMEKVARKQLEKACPDPTAVVTISQTPITSPPKKSSVAAAIAASRAKAKQIATAPPTLRHQVTSHVPAAAATARRAVSPAARTRTPPAPTPSPRSRILSAPQLPSQQARPSLPMPIVQPRSTNGFPSSSSTSGSSHSPPSSPSPSSPTSQRRVPPSPLAPGSPPRRTSQLRSSVSARSLSPPLVVPAKKPAVAATVAASIPLPPTPKMTPPPIEDESLMRIATPTSGSDSDEQHLISFSTPFELYPPHQSSSPNVTPINLTPTTPVNIPHPVVEDALRARAEQAESAADRLLEELIEPEGSAALHNLLPPSLLVSSGSTSNGSAATTPRPPSAARQVAEPVTPINKNAIIARQAAMFKNSPAFNGSSPSLLDVLRDKKHETGWWLKKIALMEQGTPLKPHLGDQSNELRQHISALENGTTDTRVMQKLALICASNPAVIDDLIPSPASSFAARKLKGTWLPPSPSPQQGAFPSSLELDIWKGGKLFDNLFTALLKFLDYQKPEELLEYGLIVIWEMLDHQASYIEGHEPEIFMLLFKIRYSNQLHVWEATNTIRDALVARIDPIYGLTTLNASLRTFLAEPLIDPTLLEARSGSHAFGLIAMGKIVLRLPAEVLEEELPRLKGTLTTGLNDSTSLIVRESAAASITASQLVLRDETHLFTLLDGLADDKKNLLTYLFDKHGARGPVEGTGLAPSASSGIERLEKEMSRLDTRMSTPPRAGRPL